MVSGNSEIQSKMEVEESQGQPPRYEDRDDQVMSVREGLYTLTNKKSRTNLDLCDGNPTKGTQVHGYEQHTEEDMGNQIWLIMKDGSNDTYSVRNLQSGTFLDLFGTDRQNGSKVVGWPRVLGSPGRSSQEWRIEERELDYHTIQCARTDTFLEILGGNSTNCAGVTCSEAADQEWDHQLWRLELISRTGTEIKSIFKSWKPNIGPLLLQSHDKSSQYFVLPNQPRQDIWKKAGLLRQPLRSHFFDYDNFVICMKDAVTLWATNRFQADVRGYSVLFGMIYGEARRGPKAYNWYISRDMCSLLFFDAQSGKEYSPAALDGFGFEPTFAIF